MSFAFLKKTDPGDWIGDKAMQDRRTGTEEMFDFDEYCEIMDAVSGRTYIRGETDFSCGLEKSGHADSLIWYAAVTDIQEDEAYFEAIINQSDLETLNRLLPYFEEGTRIEKIILNRIRLIQTYGGKALKKKDTAGPVSGNTFFQYLCSWIDKKGFKSDSDFYNQAGISRQTFSKMRNSKSQISREMALHMAVALGLDYEEGVEFLNYAGYSFNPNSRREQILSFLMRKRKYTFYEMEELLSVLHEKTFLSWD